MIIKSIDFNGKIEFDIAPVLEDKLAMHAMHVSHAWAHERMLKLSMLEADVI